MLPKFIESENFHFVTILFLDVTFWNDVDSFDYSGNEVNKIKQQVV